MKRYSIHLSILLSVAVALGACSKKELQSENFHYGNVLVELLDLPGKPAVDLYVEAEKKQTFKSDPGYQLVDVAMLSDEKVKLSAYRADTKELLTDTILTIQRNTENRLRLACSDALGLARFIGSTSTIHPDSCSFQVFNELPVELQPEGVDIDLYIYQDQVEYAVLSHLERNKLRGDVITIAVANPDKTQPTYTVKFKNRSTGEFLLDKSAREETYLYPASGGKFAIVTLTSRIQRQKLQWLTSTAEL